MVSPEERLEHINRSQSFSTHCSLETNLLLAIAKKRNDVETALRSYYGQPINGIDVWPGYCNKFFPEWYCDTLIKQPMNIPCWDHPRVIKYEDLPYMVSEPYNSSMSDMKELIRFCEERGLGFNIDGDSAHFPGRCYRIIFHENKRNNNE